MTPLIERLRNWQTIYPEDEDKPEGSLYLEAANALELLNRVRNKPDETNSGDTYREG